MARKRPRLRVIPLGGLDEIGKNMTVIEYGQDMVVIDAGLMFPDEDLPGVDLVLPQYDYILERQDKLRGIIITHGHEDHTGALPYLMRDLDRNVPVYGSRLTLGLIGVKLEEAQIKKPKLMEITAADKVTVGPFTFEFIPVNHSIPDGMAVLVRTPVGNVLHTGDFKFDQTPIDGRRTDYSALTAAGDEGVLLLLSDSTNAETPGYTRSEAEVGRSLRRIFSEAEGRVIVASFASHIHRMQQVCDAAVESGRKVAVTGRSMINNTAIARELGYLDIAESDIVDAYDMQGLAPQDTVVLSTGSQGEPMSALARMANADHRVFTVESDDTVVISATPVPGNEKAVSRVINRLFRAGANVFHKSNADVHVSGHAAAEELKLMLSLVRPRFFMPVHGETRHLHAHSKIARSMGMGAENIFVLENGDCLELTKEKAEVAERVTSGVVYVDGLGVGDVGHVVLRDRQVLSRDGIATIVVAIDHQTGARIGDAEVVMRGVMHGPESGDLMEQVRARLDKVLGKMEREGVTDQGIIGKAARESVSQTVWENVRRRPMVIPIVMEV